MLGKSLGEASALFDASLEAQDYGPELHVFILLAYGLEGILKTDSGADHDGKLIGEVEDVFSAGAELDSEVSHFLHGAFTLGCGTLYQVRIPALS
jgi:hypothetical protein